MARYGWLSSLVDTSRYCNKTVRRSLHRTSEHNGEMGSTDLLLDSSARDGRCCVSIVVHFAFNWNYHVETIADSIVFSPTTNPQSFHFFRRHSDLANEVNGLECRTENKQTIRLDRIDRTKIESIDQSFRIHCISFHVIMDTVPLFLSRILFLMRSKIPQIRSFEVRNI